MITNCFTYITKFNTDICVHYKCDYQFLLYRKHDAAARLIKRYYYQLTDGCGEPECLNEFCASSRRFCFGNLGKNEAAAKALELFKHRNQLCKPSRSSKVTRSGTDSQKSCTPTDSVDGAVGSLQPNTSMLAEKAPEDVSSPSVADITPSSSFSSITKTTSTPKNDKQPKIGNLFIIIIIVIITYYCSYFFDVLLISLLYFSNEIVLIHFLKPKNISIPFS